VVGHHVMVFTDTVMTDPLNMCTMAMTTV